MQRFLVLAILFLTNGLSAQDSIALANINIVFGGLPVVETYETILAKAEKDKRFQVIRSKSEDTYSNIIVNKYDFHTANECKECHLSVLKNDNERILRLTLNFKDLNQSSYNELLKKILAQIIPHVKNIEQNFGAGGSLETWLSFSNSTITPRLQIAEPSENFTRLVIDYVSLE
ncbi:MAG: hypothetical protein AB8F74_19715 [Saprospiraceae bacterium]